MSEPEVMPDSQPVESATSLGMLLQTAREERGLTLEEVSAFLRFSVGQLSSLESDQYGAFSNRVYLQGIARNYGKFLEVDSAKFDAALKLALPADSSPAIALPYTQEKFESSGIRLPFMKPLLLVLGLGAVAFGAVYVGKSKFQSLVSHSTASSVAVDVASSVEGTASELAVASSTKVAMPDLSPASVASTPVAPSAASGKLSVATTESAWIEIRGDKGNKLFSQIVSPGTPVELPASKPLQLKIGKASHVTLMFNGQPIDLKTYMKGEVAKFTLE